jgi:hypothetical protein
VNMSERRLAMLDNYRPRFSRFHRAFRLFAKSDGALEVILGPRLSVPWNLALAVTVGVSCVGGSAASGARQSAATATSSSSVPPYGLFVVPGTTGQPISGIAELHSAGFEPDVEAIVSDGAGGWYVGGDFNKVDNVGCTNLVHVIPHHPMSKQLCLPTNGVVLSLVRVGSSLFVGGIFTNVAETPRNYLAKVDTRTGKVGAWNPRLFGAFPQPGARVFPGQVEAIAVSGAVVYAGGAFQLAGGVKTPNVVALDARTAAPISGWVPSRRLGNANVVTALALTGHRLLVGGDPFGLVALDSRTGRELVRAVPPFREATPYIGGLQVYAITVTRSTIYVGGQFSNVGNKQRTGVAALDSRTLHVTNWYPGFARVKSTPAILSQVFSIAVDARRVYLAGGFSKTGKPGSEMGIAAVDTGTGRHIFWSVKRDSGNSGYVQAIAVARGLVVFGPGLCKGDEYSCTYPHPSGS